MTGSARRLTAFVEREVARELAPLFRLKAAELGGGARGLAFQLIEELGTAAARHGQAPGRRTDQGGSGGASPSSAVPAWAPAGSGWSR